MELTEYSEMLAYKIWTPGNYPEESIKHSEHGESVKSRKLNTGMCIGLIVKLSLIQSIFMH
jgi:hypothetical protein